MNRLVFSDADSFAASQEETENQNTVSATSQIESQPSTSFYNGPFDIVPIPQKGGGGNSNRGTEADVITASLYKVELNASIEMKS